jgi:hypothetical protein
VTRVLQQISAAARETHRDVDIFFQQLEHGIDVVGKPVAASEGAPA